MKNYFLDWNIGRGWSRQASQKAVAITFLRSPRLGLLSRREEMRVFAQVTGAGSPSRHQRSASAQACGPPLLTTLYTTDLSVMHVGSTLAQLKSVTHATFVPAKQSLCSSEDWLQSILHNLSASTSLPLPPGKSPWSFREPGWLPAVCPRNTMAFTFTSAIVMLLINSIRAQWLNSPLSLSPLSWSFMMSGTAAYPCWAQYLAHNQHK